MSYLARVLLTLILTASPILWARPLWSAPTVQVTIHGRVLDSRGAPVAGASVRLDQARHSQPIEVMTDANGNFAFSGIEVGTVSLIAQKSNRRSRVAVVLARGSADQPGTDLVLEDPDMSGAGGKSTATAQAIEFADNPSFAVSGVTDWTAAGGHGSDAILRTSEALNREALKLKDSDSNRNKESASDAPSMESEAALRTALIDSPDSFDSNHKLGEYYLHEGRFQEAVSLLEKAFDIDSKNTQNEIDLARTLLALGDVAESREHIQQLLETGANGDVHRLAGELDEKSGDPLAAVHQFEQAARMDPSEQNYFEWGSELLLHRAVWQAKEIFEQGIKTYPASVRMLTALGAALFAGALYDDSAIRLCQASDLDPDNQEPYLFMGKIEIAAPNPLECVQQKLARYVKSQPGNPLANYYFAMTLWKQGGPPVDGQRWQQIEAMLVKAVTLDPKCSDAYLQLGKLFELHDDFVKAIESYAKAIDANPQMSEAHYRLGMAYDRVGDRAKAKQEFELHEELERQQAAVVDRERREVKQFVVVGRDN